MELRKVSFELRVTPSLLFYENMYKIGHELSSIYANWETTGLEIRLTDPQTISEAWIGHFHFISAMDLPSSLHSFKERALKGAKVYMNSLDFGEIRRAETRFFYIHPLDLPFEKLVFMLQEKTFKPVDNFKTLAGSEFTDVGFAVVFKKGNYNIRMQFGPVTEQEIEQRIPPIGLIRGEQNKRINPEVAMFYDVSFFVDGERSFDPEGFLLESHKHVNEIVSKMKKLMMEV